MLIVLWRPMFQALECRTLRLSDTRLCDTHYKRWCQHEMINKCLCWRRHWTFFSLTNSTENEGKPVSPPSCYFFRKFSQGKTRDRRGGGTSTCNRGVDAPSARKKEGSLPIENEIDCFVFQVIMGDRPAAERACKDPNPIIDGRKANVNLAILGAKPRGTLPPGKLLHPLMSYRKYFAIGIFRY